MMLKEMHLIFSNFCKKKNNKNLLPKYFPVCFYFFPDLLPVALILCSAQSSLPKMHSAQASVPVSSFAAYLSSPVAH